MSATDTIRAMLDELNIKHFDFHKGGWTQTQWEAPDGNRHFTYETYDNPAKTAKLVISWFPTPEQAIEATLGRGECRDLRDHPDRLFHCSACRKVADAPKLAYCPYCGREVIE